jgi:heat shock 70kDa protein 1/2/6/8
VNAREESTGKSKNIKIKNEKGRLNKSEIEKMIADAEKYREEDEKSKIRVGSRNSLESYLFSIRSAIKEYAAKFNDKDRTAIEKIITQNIEWLEANRECEASTYEGKFNDMQNLIMPIMNKLHKNDQIGPKIEELLDN